MAILFYSTICISWLPEVHTQHVYECIYVYILFYKDENQAINV